MSEVIHEGFGITPLVRRPLGAPFALAFLVNEGYDPSDVDSWRVQISRANGSVIWENETVVVNEQLISFSYAESAESSSDESLLLSDILGEGLFVFSLTAYAPALTWRIQGNYEYVTGLGDPGFTATTANPILITVNESLSFSLTITAGPSTTGTNTGDQDLSGYVLTTAIDTLAELNNVITDATLIDTNDARLSDARTPTAHKASHATGGADALTAADIGALASSAVSAFGATLIANADAAIARATLGVGTSDTPTFGGVKIGGANGNILHGSGSGGYEIFWHPGNFWFLTRPDRTPILAAGIDRFIIANPTLQLGDTTDHGISRIGAGQIEVNNGTIGQRRDFFARAITAAESLRPGSYTVATVPAAASHTAGLIFVTDETGGAVPAFSDGANWRRVTDRAIIS